MFRSKASNVAYRLLRRKATTIPRICSYSVAIVGSGPSGCYTAKYLPSSYQIDLIERLPTPYGLVRYGVAPDHPEVKNVQNDFDQSLPERTRLFANVTVGQDVSVEELREMYDAVVLAYGCQSDRKLGVPGEELQGVLSAREFVAWYNGHPDFDHIGPVVSEALHDPSTSSVVVIGHGNVALDCARILAKGATGLYETDLAARALPVLGNGVASVRIVGRRGHVQAAFTIKELRELGKLKDEGHDTMLIVRQEELDLGLTEASKTVLEKSRPRSRIHTLLRDFATTTYGTQAGRVGPKTFLTTSNSDSKPSKTVDLRFLQRPVEFEPLEDKPGSLGAVVCERTTLVGEAEHQDAVGTGVQHKIPASLALVSIGYQGEPLPGTEQWFDSRKGVLQHQGSLVASPEDRLGGLFTAGWLKRGPSGIIGTNIPDAKETAASIVSVVERQPPKESDDSSLTSHLHDRQVKVVTWEGYRRIAQKETEMKRHANQPREKIVSVRDMLATALAS